jgi:hypothetical protein
VQRKIPEKDIKKTQPNKNGWVFQLKISLLLEEKVSAEQADG